MSPNAFAKNDFANVTFAAISALFFVRFIKRIAYFPCMKFNATGANTMMKTAGKIKIMSGIKIF